MLNGKINHTVRANLEDISTMPCSPECSQLSVPGSPAPLPQRECRVHLQSVQRSTLHFFHPSCWNFAVKMLLILFILHNNRLLRKHAIRDMRLVHVSLLSPAPMCSVLTCHSLLSLQVHVDPLFRVAVGGCPRKPRLFKPCA